MARITKIEATKSFIEKKKIRVAAYARVSTKHRRNIMTISLVRIPNGNMQDCIMMKASPAQRWKSVMDCLHF